MNSITHSFNTKAELKLAGYKKVPEELYNKQKNNSKYETFVLETFFTVDSKGMFHKITKESQNELKDWIFIPKDCQDNLNECFTRIRFFSRKINNSEKQESVQKTHKKMVSNFKSKNIKESIYFHDDIKDGADANLFLKNRKVGEAILRFSKSNDFYTISFKAKNGEIVHCLLGGNPLDDGFLNSNIKVINDAEPGYNISLIPKDGLEKAQTLNEKKEKKESALKPKYDRQLVLNLGTGNTGRGLNEKALKKGSAGVAKMCDLRTEKLKKEKLTPFSRVYIIGHCNKGLSHIESDDKKIVTVKQFAKMIARAMGSPNGTTSEQRLKINLVACEAANRNEKYDSFAHQLSLALANKSIHADVIARNESVVRRQDDETGPMHIRTQTEKNDPKKSVTKFSYYTNPVTKKTIKTKFQDGQFKNQEAYIRGIFDAVQMPKKHKNSG